MEKAEIIFVSDQESFKWYELSPSYQSIKLLEKIFDDLKDDDEFGFLLPLKETNDEEIVDYTQCVGWKRIVSTQKNKIYSIVIFLSDRIELMIVKNHKGKQVIKTIESDFSKNW